MKVGIIGAGRLGTALAEAFFHKGDNLGGVYSRTGAKVGLDPGIRMFDKLDTLIKACDVVLLTVPDKVISELSSQLSDMMESSLIRGRVFIHCSGAMSSKALEPLLIKGGVTGSLHPIQTFSGATDSWKRLFGISFGFEGTEEALMVCKGIVEMLEGRLIVISPEAKPLYHAAACFVSNYTVTLSWMAEKLLRAAGMSGEEGIKAFIPLLKNTVDNISELGSAGALTGPIARGDTVTLVEHLNALKGLEGLEAIYRLMGSETVRLALEKGSIDKSQADKMNNVLGE